MKSRSLLQPKVSKLSMTKEYPAIEAVATFFREGGNVVSITCGNGTAMEELIRICGTLPESEIEKLRTYTSEIKATYEYVPPLATFRTNTARICRRAGGQIF